MNVAIIGILLIINIPIYKFIFKGFFYDIEDFKESLGYIFTPDLFSLFRGKYWQDRMSEMKAGGFIFLCIVITVLEFFLIQYIFEAIKGLL
ncbi:hypothetical protein [Sporosalibacterium faouarense]|uniref:hypothetical protein n=1 Tax=Sporosalibacterium faouarense TaxID=516123 RepID=UPI00141CBDCB|nr:hypothetical protein [Sporosalibacterium faouarense]MTI47947.1 hypothetical protein [Bacillota bacterium]